MVEKAKAFKFEGWITWRGDDILVVFETERYKGERFFEFEGYHDTARKVRDHLLGEVANLSIKRIEEIMKETESSRGTHLSK